MEMHLRKYLWMFFGYYSIGYLVIGSIIFLVNLFLNWSATDILAIISLCMTIPLYISQKFIKNEGRFFSELELKSIINKSVFIAWGISILSVISFFGYCFFVKLFAQEEIPLLLYHDNSASDIFLQMPIMHLCIAFLSVVFLYYIAIYFLIRRSFKKASKQYYKKHGRLMDKSGIINS